MHTLHHLLANMITPLMFNQWMHLLVGNIFIGLLEGIVIAKVFKVRMWKTIAVLIIANYLSAAAAFALFGVAESRGPFVPWLFAEPLHQVSLILWLGFGIAFGLSILIEWPLVYTQFRDKPLSGKRSFQAVLLAQVVSYSLLAPAYWLQSENPLGQEVRIARTLDIPPETAGAIVYFIGTDGDIYRMPLTGRLAERVADMDVRRRGVRSYRQPVLYVAQQGAEERRVTVEDATLGAQHELRYYSGYPAVYLASIVPLHGRTEFAYQALYDGTIETDYPATLSDFMMHGMVVTDLRPPSERAWSVQPRFHMGMNVRNESAGESYRVAFQTVFDTWTVRTVTLLPGDIAVFEFGGQVCVLDVPGRTIALLTRGWAPVVEMDN